MYICKIYIIAWPVLAENIYKIYIIASPVLEENIFIYNICSTCVGRNGKAPRSPAPLTGRTPRPAFEEDISRSFTIKAKSFLSFFDSDEEKNEIVDELFDVERAAFEVETAQNAVNKTQQSLEAQEALLKEKEDQ